MLRKLVIDIETIATQREDVIDYIATTIKPPKTMSVAATIEKWHRESKQDAIDDAIRSTGLDGAFGQVVVIGMALDDDEPETFYGLNEFALLAEFNLALNDIPHTEWLSTQVIGFNHQAFDLRFLLQRHMVNRIVPHTVILRAAKAKAWEDAITFDCMTQFAGFGNRISLDKTCLALGIPSPKGDMDGSMVNQAVLDGRLNEVAAYCKRDVAATREVYRRLTFAEV